MKLYSADLSPFAARARLAIYAKGLPIEIAPPAGGGLKSAEYLAINPLGKVPALVLDDGTVIIESDTICEYLEDAFPEKPLRPADALGKAKVRIIERVAEMYVMAAMQPLFAHMNPKARDQAAVDALLEKLDSGLGHLNVYLSGGKYAAGDAFSTADCALIPLMFFIALGERTFEVELLSKHSKVGPYWAAMQGEELTQKVGAELMRGLAAFRSQAA